MSTMHHTSLTSGTTQIFLTAILIVTVLLSACNKADTVVAQPLELTPGALCSLDGMPLADYPGSKAQIQYNQGEVDLFCDTIEMFAVYLKPEQQRRVRAMYVQDMAKTDWNQPVGHWIDAKRAFYVAGSKKYGSMGPTLASFANEADARAFAVEHSGKVYRFDQITPDMVVLDGGVIKDHVM